VLRRHCYLVIAAMAFLTVIDLFAAQALLPALAERYGVSPRVMGLAVNSSTLGMAIAGLSVAVIGWQGNRRRAVSFSLILLAVPTLLLAVAPNIQVFAALRVIQGLIMATAFSLTLGYMGDKYSASIVKAAFAAYITGNVASNFFGRLISVAIYDSAGLGPAFVSLAGLNIAGAFLALYLFGKEQPRVAAVQDGPAWREHLTDPILRPGFLVGFFVLFAFLGVFTYMNFHLTRAGFGLTMAQLGLIHFVFLPSIVTTPLSALVTERLSHRVALSLFLVLAVAGLPLLLSDQILYVAGGCVWLQLEPLPLRRRRPDTSGLLRARTAMPQAVFISPSIISADFRGPRSSAGCMISAGGPLPSVASLQACCLPFSAYPKCIFDRSLPRVTQLSFPTVKHAIASTHDRWR
jgi:YNFM family putative membrane transporter